MGTRTSGGVLLEPKSMLEEVSNHCLGMDTPLFGMITGLGQEESVIKYPLSTL